MVGLSEALFYLAKGCGLLYSSARKTLLALRFEYFHFDNMTLLVLRYKWTAK